MIYLLLVSVPVRVIRPSFNPFLDDFLKHGGGMICFYSLKNPGYPEYIFQAESGVLCLDIHPELHSLICVGFNDGSVGVYKLNQEKEGPLYLSTAYSNKNTDPVWQVKWLRSDEQPSLVFYSISSDGRVSSWSILKVIWLFSQNERIQSI